MKMHGSFRFRILAIVLIVGIVPVFVIGVWLTGQTARSGEALLRERLEESLDRTASSVTQRWIPYRSDLLDLVERDEVRVWLEGVRNGGSSAAPPGLTAWASALDPVIVGIAIHADGDALWTYDRESGGGSAFGAPLTVSLPIHAKDGRGLGRLEARIRFAALQGPAEAAATGGVISAIDPVTQAVLLSVPFDPTLVGAASFTWNDQEWIGVTREVAEPPVRLAAAAMAQPFAEPFESTARRSLFVLLSVAALGFLTVVALTGRLTASLEKLATAARGVTGGDLTRTLPVETSDEVGAVTEAFNTMIRSLRRTLRQLAERESLAAVNEFAASLAHEVRNPLTSVQLDLQQVEESLPAESDLRVLQGEALQELRRLDRTVARALEVARSGRVEPRPIDLATPLRAAVRRARPEVERRGGQLEVHLPANGLPMLGDPDALEQLFLNLLLNAAAAIGSGQRISVLAEAGDEAVEVRIRDEGAGIPAADLERIFEPFFTTREGGTGLGLAVARRIAVAHRGAIQVRSDERAGTTVEVELPFDGSHHFAG